MNSQKRYLFVKSFFELPEGFHGDISDAVVLLAGTFRTEGYFTSNPVVSTDKRAEIAANFEKSLKADVARGIPVKLGRTSANILTFEFESVPPADGNVNTRIVDVAAVPLKKSNINKPIVG